MNGKSIHRCPKCAADDIGVYDSRPLKTGREPVIRRMRKCASCHARWTTYEITKDAYELLVRAASAMTSSVDAVMPQGRAKLRSRANIGAGIDIAGDL